MILSQNDAFKRSGLLPPPRTTFMRINKLIWRHLPQAMRVKTFYLLFIFSWDSLTACRGGSLNYSYRVSHWDSSRRRGGRRNNNTTLPWLTISYLNIWSLYLYLWVITDCWQLGMYFQIFSYCLTISQWCKSVFRVVVVSLYFICNRNSNRPALLTLLTRLGHGWLRWGGAGRVRAGRGVRMLQCYREMAARARSPDISGDQWPGEGASPVVH